MRMRNVATAAAVIFLGTAFSSLNWAQDDSPFSEREVNEWNVRESRATVEAQKAAAKDAAKMAAKAAVAAKSEEIRIRKFFPPQFGFPRHLTQIQEVAEQYSNGKDEKQKAK